MDILSLGSKIKLKRKEKNMKLKDLAGDRITPGQISLIETGKSNPSEDLLRYLAKKLDTTIEYLLESEEKQAEDICIFYSDIVECSLQCGNYLRAEENIEKGLHYANKYDIDLYKGILTYKKACLEFYRGDYNLSQKEALSSLVIFLKNSNDHKALDVFILLGEITFKEENYRLAYGYFKEAEKSYNKAEVVDKLIRLKIYYNIAKCLTKLSNNNKAIEYALMVKKEISLVEDYNLHADTLMVLANSYAKNKDKEKALKYASEARNICSQKKDIMCIANIEEGIGDLLIDSFSIEEGISHLKRAYEIKKTIKSKNINDIIMKVILGFIKCEEYNSALSRMKLLEDSKEISIDLKVKLIEYRYIIYKKLNEKKKCEKEILDLIKTIRFIDNKKKLEHYLMLIASFYKDAGEDKIALKYFQEAYDVRESAI